MEPSPGDLKAKSKAALISLVRNEELDGILQSMRQLEYRWNKRFGYPWLFFSEVPFSEEFKGRHSARHCLTPATQKSMMII